MISKIEHCAVVLCFSFLSFSVHSTFCLFTLFSVVNFRSLKDSARIFFPRKKKENLPIRLVSRKGWENDKNLRIFLTKNHFWYSISSWLLSQKFYSYDTYISIENIIKPSLFTLILGLLYTFLSFTLTGKPQFPKKELEGLVIWL